MIGGATVGGGLIGMAVGILGGPLGMLLGWGAGSLIGGFADADRVDRSETAIGELEAAEAAAIAADREAARVLHEERRQERKQKWEDRVESLRERLRRKNGWN